MSSYFRHDELVLRMALEIESAEHPDMMLVFLPGIDRVSHFLWGSIEPAELYPKNLRPSPDERREGREALERYYAYTDAMIGLLLEHYRPDDLVMVLSDHGFEAGSEIGILTGVHRGEAALDGVLFARGAGLPSGERIDGIGILDVTPTILAWLRLPVGEDMDGRPAAFVGGERVERVATHDVGPVERLESAASGSETEILENLRALGYIDED
jgi:predicted AlkP superfamily phosphohydrolase/phosphomutase